MRAPALLAMTLVAVLGLSQAVAGPATEADIAGILASPDRLEPARPLTYEVPAGRHLWLQLVRGILALEGGELREGDGAAMTDERAIRLDPKTEAEILLLELA